MWKFISFIRKWIKNCVNLQNLLRGGGGDIGKQLLNQAGTFVAGAAKEFIGNAIQEMFVKKQTDVKRVLPSIKNMKIVSVKFYNSVTFGKWQARIRSTSNLILTLIKCELYANYVSVSTVEEFMAAKECHVSMNPFSRVTYFHNRKLFRLLFHNYWYLAGVSTTKHFPMLSLEHYWQKSQFSKQIDFFVLCLKCVCVRYQSKDYNENVKSYRPTLSLQTF